MMKPALTPQQRLVLTNAVQEFVEREVSEVGGNDVDSVMVLALAVMESHALVVLRLGATSAKSEFDNLFQSLSPAYEGLFAQAEEELRRRSN